MFPQTNLILAISELQDFVASGTKWTSWQILDDMSSVDQNIIAPLLNTELSATTSQSLTARDLKQQALYREYGMSSFSKLPF